MTGMTEDLDSKDVVEEPEDMELGLNLIRQVPLGIVFLRIVIVIAAGLVGFFGPGFAVDSMVDSRRRTEAFLAGCARSDGGLCRGRPRT